MMRMNMAEGERFCVGKITNFLSKLTSIFQLHCEARASYYYGRYYMLSIKSILILKEV